MGVVVKCSSRGLETEIKSILIKISLNLSNCLEFLNSKAATFHTKIHKFFHSIKSYFSVMYANHFQPCTEKWLRIINSRKPWKHFWDLINESKLSPIFNFVNKSSGNVGRKTEIYWWSSMISVINATDKRAARSRKVKWKVMIYWVVAWSFLSGKYWALINLA